MMAEGVLVYFSLLVMLASAGSHVNIQQAFHFFSIAAAAGEAARSVKGGRRVACVCFLDVLEGAFASLLRVRYGSERS